MSTWWSITGAPERRNFKRTFSIFLAFLLAGTNTAQASGGGNNALVGDIGFCLALAGVLAILFVRFRVPTIAAFIAAGAIAGPLGLARVTDAGNIEVIAELGFILLLFTIGLEIDFKGLNKGGRVILVTGVLQFPLTVLFGYCAARLVAMTGLFGGLIDGRMVPLYIGASIAGSSTLLVIKLFQDSFELDTVPGRVSLGVLIFQDLWAIVLIILQPSLDAPRFEPVLASFAGIVLLTAIAFAMGKTVLKTGLKWVAKSSETVAMVAVGWCFLVVLIGNGLGAVVVPVHGAEVTLSVGAGMSALIAGMVIASLPYAAEVTSKVGVLKDFFVTLFFVGLGMSVPAPHNWNIPLLALMIAATASLSRLVVFFPLMYLAGLDHRNAAVASIRLAQISEFGLVVVVLGIELGQLSKEQGSAIILAFVMTALATAPLFRFAYAIHERIAPVLKIVGFRDPAPAHAAEDTGTRIAFLGFHRVASALLTDIEREDRELMPGILVVDFNVALHNAIKAKGATVRYGDFSRAETLIHAGLDTAPLIVSTIPDDLMRGTDNRRLVAMLRKINPAATIIANAVRLDDVAQIYAAGADFVYLGHIETARALMPTLHQALNGTLGNWVETRVDQEGQPQMRADVLR